METRSGGWCNRLSALWFRWLCVWQQVSVNTGQFLDRAWCNPPGHTPFSNFIFMCFVLFSSLFSSFYDPFLLDDSNDCDGLHLDLLQTFVYCHKWSRYCWLCSWEWIEIKKIKCASLIGPAWGRQFDSQSCRSPVWWLRLHVKPALLCDGDLMNPDKDPCTSTCCSIRIPRRC